MRKARRYRAIDVCNLFGISKSTLLRWEKEELLGTVDTVPQGMHKSREYSSENLLKIVRKFYSQSLRHDEKAKDKKPSNETISWQKKSCIYKYILGDEKGLNELIESEFGLDPNDIKLLIKYCLVDYFPENNTESIVLDKQFCQVIDLINKSYCHP